jgi:hypothetical protein
LKFLREGGDGKMASKTHHLIKRIVREIIKEYNFNRKGIPVLEEANVIKLNDPDSKEVIEYKPDFILRRNLTKHTYYFVIFEVIEDQTDTKTMADIARVLAKSEINKAIFISCNPKKLKETDRIISVLLGSYKDVFRKKKKDEIINIVSKEWFKSKKKFEETFINKRMILEELKNYLPKKMQKK